MPSALSRRRAFLLAALGFLELDGRYRPNAVGALEKWMPTWSGVGDVIAGMSALGFDVELRAFPDAWRASFCPTGLAHSIVMDTAWEPSAWRAVQRAAWAALNDPRAST